MKKNLEVNHIYGALMGVAVGDAMGMPVEMWTPEKIKSELGEITTFLPGHKENLISQGASAGEVTDDTVVTLILAESIIAEGGRIIPEKVLGKILAWSEENKEKAMKIIGPSTKKAFELLAQGIPMTETGKFGVTNGGAMRMIPIGIVSDWRKLDQLVENVRLACMATHNTSTAIGGAAAIAAAVSYAIDGEQQLEAMLEIAKLAYEKGKKLGYETVDASISKRLDLGIEIVNNGNNDQEILKNLYEIIGAGVATSESVPVALSLVYLAKGDPVKCAYLAANLGGDTDTIGAMACGICGGFSGIQAFPLTYIQLINQENDFDLFRIVQELWRYRLQNQQ